VSKLRTLHVLPGSQRLGGDDDGGRGKGEYASVAADECAICAEDDATLLPARRSTSLSAHPHKYPLNTPYVTSCGHMYCYTCVADRLLRAADDGEAHWACVRCDAPVTDVHRLELADDEGTSEFDLDEMSLHSEEDTFGTFSSSDGAMSE
jgi:peroxin-2